jgi:hypothetical protein
MAKAVSCRDVLHVLKAKGIWSSGALGLNKELLVISRDQEELIKPILFELGIDVRFPIKVDVMNHRDLNNNTGIGFRFVGDIRKDKAYLSSPLCDIMERISIASWHDKSLGREMANIMGMRVDFAEGADHIDHQEKADDTVPDYKESLEIIRSLQNAARSIRGGEEGQSEY